MSGPSLTNKQSPFISSLLGLQQDGKNAISAPSNWTKEPLLEVETDLDEIVKNLPKRILVGKTGNTKGNWHFLIGSPGNGKSAAIGKLCRILIQGGCRVVDEGGNDFRSLSPTSLPYAFSVHEGPNKYFSAQIVQDASVVRNPFERDADPAKELLRTIRI